MSEEQPILVGVDGSAESLGALDWAIAFAQCTDLAIHVVCTYSLPSFTASSLDGGYAAIDDHALREGAQITVDEAAGRVEQAGIKVSSAIAAGDPVTVLTELTHRARLAVIGTTAGGGLADRLLGTVSATLPAHSACPTVVVPRHSGGSSFTPIRRIVVGVDGSDPGSVALRTAVSVSKLWGADLTAVSAVPMSTGVGLFGWLPSTVDREGILAEVRTALDQAVDQALDGANLQVHRHALDGNAAALLAEFSTAVDLVVVGTRGRGGFAGLLLGSTSQAVLNHSTCPVLVVPSRGAGVPESGWKWDRA